MERHRQLDLFLDESTAHLSAIERILETHSRSAPPAEAGDALLLHVHAVKGLAATLGFPELAADAHRFESAIRQGTRAIPSDRRAIAEALETLRRRVREIENDAHSEFRGRPLAVRVPVATLTGLRERLRSRLVSSIGRRSDPWARAACRDVLKELDDALETVLTVRIDDLGPTLRESARAVAVSTGKRIDVRVEDGAGAIPRTVVEPLVSPLVQLVRNAAVHGIEDPVDRRSRDKDPVGTVVVRARRIEDRLEIEIADDGRGFPDLGPGLVAHDRLADTVLVDGHTTASEPGPIAGRGVGLGVVRDGVTRQRGRLALRNDPGRGAVWTITVPVGGPRFDD